MGSTTSSTGLPFPNPTSTLQWAEDVDAIVGAPLTGPNEGVFVANAAAESPSGYGLNPSGNEQPEPGSTIVPQDVGTGYSVQSYPDWATSLAAEKSVLEQSNNATFLASLRSGKASEQTLAAELTAPGASWAGDATSSASTHSVPFAQASPASTTGTGQSQGLLGRIRHDAAAAGDAVVGAPGGVVGAAGGAVGSALSGALSGVISPLVGDLKRDIYDWAFVVFGLMLIVVGLVVTFHSAAGDAAEVGAVAAAG